MNPPAPLSGESGGVSASPQAMGSLEKSSPPPPPAGALPPQLGRWAPPGPAGAQPERGSVCGDRDGAGPRCRMRPGAKEEGSPF